MLKIKGIISDLKKKSDLGELAKLAPRKDPGFDVYWLAISLEKTKEFPDDTNRWQVEMLVKVKVEELKDMFSNLSKKVMDKIKE